ncbi:hypothetical protein [Fictibacillus gelatini]|nr:hypothetical protein [Fictibacillus gelatini]
MNMEKSDRLRMMLQEALAPIIEKMEKLEVEIAMIKENQIAIKKKLGIDE